MNDSHTFNGGEGRGPATLALGATSGERQASGRDRHAWHRTSGPVPVRSARPPVPVAVYRLCDTLAPLVALLTALVLTNLGEMTTTGVENFLAVRVSMKNLMLVAGLLVFWRVSCNAWGLYDWAQIRTARAEVLRVAGACLMVAPFTFTMPLSSVSGAFDYFTLGAFWVVTLAGTLGPRSLFHLIAMARRRPVRTVLIAGSGPRAVEVERRLLADPAVAYHVAGFVDSPTATFPSELGKRLLAPLDEVEQILLHRPIDEVIIALPLKSQYAAVERVVRSCETLGVQVTLPADPFQGSRSSFRPSDSESLFAVTLSDAPEGVRLMVKRWIDLVGAGFALLLSAPLMLGVAVAIKLTSSGPVLFRQERYGYHRRRFPMYKFRTMVMDAESLQPALEHLNEAQGPLFKIREDPRLTPIGAFLRRTSIDELPQLFNVLRGDMSLVGPRPMAVRDVLRFTETALARRFSVRPGVTGLWQVEGRSNLPYESWAALDLRYAEQWSLGLDFSILLRTLPAVLRGTGAE